MLSGGAEPVKETGQGMIFYPSAHHASILAGSVIPTALGLFAMASSIYNPWYNDGREATSMKRFDQSSNKSVTHLIILHTESSGQHTALAVGLPEIQVTAATPGEAIDGVRSKSITQLASGELVQIEIPQQNGELPGFGHADPNDPNEQA